MNVALHPRRYISLCSGGGGLDIAFELAFPGARSVCYLEREAFAVAHLVDAMEKGWLAPAPVWSDARTFDGRRWRGHVDAVIGGIPCQPHSVAGRKRGSHDERDLWSDARRIIVQSRARIVLIENVRGMLSAGADQIAGAERVWRDLRKLGFRVEGGLFSAEEVGAPHRRERLFILGVADSDGERRDGQPIRLRQGQPPQDYPEATGGGHSGVGQADAYDTGLALGQGPAVGRGALWHEGQAASARGAELEHAALDGRREGRPEHAVRSGRDAPAGAGQPVDDALFGRHEHENKALFAGRNSPVDAKFGLFPPGPGDIDAWRAIIAERPDLAPATEPPVRGLADGLAPNRIDWLRLLGNGVVPLQGAYAIRTLAARIRANAPVDFRLIGDAA